MTHPPPTGLPAETCVPELREALAASGHAVLEAPPGTGKTTVVPLRLLDEPWLAGGSVVMLEPRRLATRAAARRMASQLGEEVGSTVGYRTRDERRVGPGTRLEVVTDGVLTRRLQRDPTLAGMGLVILDELHERNLHAEMALALLLDARAGLRPDLRILAMSATMDTGRVAALLGGPGPAAPVITASAAAHPVDVRWAPVPPRRRLPDAVAATVARAVRRDPGDVLVFLPGAAEIRRTSAALAGSLPPEVDVRPLFGALSAGEQDAALAPSPDGRRRVVLATDIAETSLTVEGVRVVVDAGLNRVPRHDPRTGLTRLQTVPASRASADQRAGRAGRLGPGVAYRLWSKVEHAARRPFTDPEILTVDLAGVALELAVWGADPGELRFLDPLPDGALDEARDLLRRLGALDEGGRPTVTGRAMADLPLHPRLARMVVDGARAGDGWLACVLAALLDERDVLRGRPDELPVDVTERAALVLDAGRRHPAADGPAVAGVRRRAVELARRASVRRGEASVAATGPLLALAYPDRVAQHRGGGRFRLRTGAGAWLPATDPLAGEPFVVAADLDADRRDSRIRLAAAIDGIEVEAAAGAEVTRVETLAWDGGRDDLRARVEHRLDGLVLHVTEGPAPPGRATTAALLEQARGTGLSVLGWTGRARDLQARVAFVRDRQPGRWPDLSDEALAGSVEEWLAPHLPGATGRADLEALDLHGVLRALLGHDAATELDRLAPTNVTSPSGRALRIDYGDGTPTVAVRVQELYGLTRHPTVGGGSVPVVLHLLSPAGRPVQVTADLPRFWEGSWAEVRKEMAGRYPKHHWPLDPAGSGPAPA